MPPDPLRRPLDYHSHLLFQSRPPTSKHFETPVQGQTHQAAAPLETIQVLMFFSQRCITHSHCVLYNLRIIGEQIVTIIMLVHKIM